MTLINAVPELLNVSNVAGIQISNVGSEDVTSTILLTLAKQIDKYVCKDPSMAGAVVTHGTDVLEETAFFLDATINCGKPVVIVGAMRPATAISADGPFNLLEAVTVAVDPAAKNRGAMVVMNDRITSAYYVTKTNANTMDTFKAPEMGHLGALLSNTPYFYYPAVKPTGKREYIVSNITAIPRVDILFAYEDMSNDTLYNAVASGAKGIVVSSPRLHSFNKVTNDSPDCRCWSWWCQHSVQCCYGGCDQHSQYPDCSEHESYEWRGSNYGCFQRYCSAYCQWVLEPYEVEDFAWIVACAWKEHD